MKLSGPVGFCRPALPAGATPSGLASVDIPCRCLWRVEALHTTNSLRPRRTILQEAQMRRRVARTFMGLGLRRGALGTLAQEEEANALLWGFDVRSGWGGGGLPRVVVEVSDPHGPA